MTATYVGRSDLERRFGVDEIRSLAPLPDGAADFVDGQFVDGEDPPVPLNPQPPDPKIAAAAGDAAAEIDSTLALSYELPLTDGPYPALTSIAADLARLRMYDDTAPDRVVARAKKAREWLNNIAKAKKWLLNSDGEVQPRRVDARFSPNVGELSDLDDF